MFGIKFGEKNDVIKIRDEQYGIIQFDFNNRKILLKRYPVALTAGYENIQIDFDRITGIELKKPYSFKLGHVRFIVDNKKYVYSNGNVATHYGASKKKYALLIKAIDKLISVCPNIRLIAEDEFDVESQEYSGEFNCHGKE